MKKDSIKYIDILCALLFIGLIVGCQQQPETSTPTLTHTSTLNRIVTEQFIAKIDVSSSVLDSFIVSTNNKRFAYIAQVDNKQFVVLDGQEGKQYDGIMALTFSPNSQRVAYIAQLGDRQFVVVDGQEGKRYGIVKARGVVAFRSLFSPDSKHVAYVASSGNKSFVVVDGQEGKG